MEQGIPAGETPPRQKALPSEDPWHEWYKERPERWRGAEGSHRAKVEVNLRNSVNSLGAVRYFQAPKTSVEAWDFANAHRRRQYPGTAF